MLLIGGHGYIGSEIRRFLSKKYNITSCDLLIYDKKKEKIKIKDKNRKLVVKNFNSLQPNYLEQFNYIILLAGLVGDPISKKYSALSFKNDVVDLKKLVKKISKIKIEKAIFVSTCSNYGFKKNNKLLNEKAKLKPLSLYAKAKVEIEKFIMRQKTKSLTSFSILRFATAYGLSKNRMRFDLTINQFIFEALKYRKIVIYDKNTVRPYCHVRDFSNIIYKILCAEKKLTNFEVFNCGFNKSNYSKYRIIQLIKKHLGFKFMTEYANYSFDKRNYKVDFSKLKKILNIKSIVNEKEAFLEIKNFIKNKNVNALKKLGNYKIYL